jgi:hypothetical protein
VVNGQHTVVVRPLSLLAIPVSYHEKVSAWWRMGVFEEVECQVLPSFRGRYAPSKATPEPRRLEQKRRCESPPMGFGAFAPEGLNLTREVLRRRYG